VSHEPKEDFVLKFSAASQEDHSMPLQNRVDPLGELFADSSRGLFMGNRGGRFHDDDRRLGRRRWVSRAWICCRLDFKGRHREVWGGGYTELFFLDEPTALAAGHRPCFECRRLDAKSFAAAFARGMALAATVRAAEIDAVLHDERLLRRKHRIAAADLPDGAFVELTSEPGKIFAARGPALLQWTPSGYASRRSRVSAAALDALTPPAILAALRAGYHPHWHPSAFLR
jgi:hypothetical protein